MIGKTLAPNSLPLVTPLAFVRRPYQHRYQMWAPKCSRCIVLSSWAVVKLWDNHFDVLLAVQNAIMPRRKRKDFSIPGMVYESGGGFVSEVCPKAAYACWQVLKFDNAKAHLAEDTLNSLCEFVGCRVDAGPVMHPALRPYIERFFRTLTDRLSRRLPGTSGNSPQDPAGIKGKALAVEQLVLIEELEELLDVTFANYNGTAHDGLNGRTPLQAMQFFLDERKVVLRTLALSKRARIHQLKPLYQPRAAIPVCAQLVVQFGTQNRSRVDPVSRLLRCSRGGLITLTKSCDEYLSRRQPRPS